MKNFRNRPADFFAGRYGVDELGRFMLIIVAVSVVISALTRSSGMYMFNVIILAVCAARMFSGNISSRMEENDVYLDIRNRVIGVFNKEAAGKVRDSDYRYFRCPNCSQTVRVPRGKGNISIRCPKCKAEFIRRS